MKLESLVIANQHVAVNSLEVLYTPPVTSRKFFWLENYFQKNKFIYIFNTKIYKFVFLFPVHKQKFDPDEVVTR